MNYPFTSITTMMEHLIIVIAVTKNLKNGNRYVFIWYRNIFHTVNPLYVKSAEQNLEFLLIWPNILGMNWLYFKKNLWFLQLCTSPWKSIFCLIWLEYGVKYSIFYFLKNEIILFLIFSIYQIKLLILTTSSGCHCVLLHIIF